MTIFRYYGNGLWKVIETNQKSNLPTSLEPLNHNDYKLKNNIRRAAETIEEYGLCNDWSFFLTLTIDGNKRSRSDLDSYLNDLSQFFRDMRKKYKSDIKYLIVPELHKDGENWHSHALVYGLPLLALKAFTLDDNIPAYIRMRILSGYNLYDWPDYSRKFGFCDIEPIQDKERCTRYIKKYISKGLLSTAEKIAVGKHLYIASKGLKKSIKIEVSHKYSPNCPIDINLCKEESGYTWDYGSATWYRESEI